jgi:hypothetical protein
VRQGKGVPISDSCPQVKILYKNYKLHKWWKYHRIYLVPQGLEECIMSLRHENGQIHLSCVHMDQNIFRTDEARASFVAAKKPVKFPVGTDEGCLLVRFVRPVAVLVPAL